MVNIEDFIKRLELLLEYYNLSASAFADKIDVQRSSISHLLSGRNKPSLDFILKVIEVFPDVDLYWILNGKGTFPKSEKNNEEEEKISPTLQNENFQNDTSLKNNVDLFSEIETVEKKTINEKSSEIFSNMQNFEAANNLIEYIVVFYKDGTFKKYNSRQ
ncbi:helix-turn-helix transcriptional regulator [Flavobacterium sediminilitoris]|uniref:Helix-turn-helix transcriptional regulator n=1 Tax=Flavobacterium sediminilitoris TaxID=2024526 RepID=A0ABY4HP33_9FLAO|nr:MULTISPECIES: helix-turn-helix transcriptional regulator [Flavobacterium]UOX33279.1 helix-turn-helix transcriptional regulator [Flavobacterium sediminilitoris]